MKNCILPLGCHFHPPPDASKRCDNPSCSVSSDLPWKLFEGCWRSFHLCCLNGLNVCVICQDGLKKNMKSLSKTANEAFAGGLQTTRPDEGQECLDDGEVEEQFNNNDDDDDEAIPEIAEVNVNHIIPRLTRQLFNIQVNQLSVNTTEVDDESNQTDQPTGRRPYHCTVRSNRRQGHQHQTETGEIVTHSLYCPNQVCRVGGGGAVCSCQWCEQHINQPSPSSSSSLSSRVMCHRPIAPAVSFQNQRGDVTEWVVPVCQSSVSGELGSNACTIIAVLVAVNFLLPTGWILPSPHNSLPQSFVSMFKDLMVQGNIVRQWLGHAQQNYMLKKRRKKHHPAVDKKTSMTNS